MTIDYKAIFIALKEFSRTLETSVALVLISLVRGYFSVEIIVFRKISMSLYLIVYA